MMATFDIDISGSGGHAARPHLTQDPLLVGCQIASGMQTIISRAVDPLEAAVVSVTSFRAGEAYNVIPSEARIRGTVRAFSEATFSSVEQRLRSIAAGYANAFGVDVDVDYRKLVDPLINDQAEARTFCDTAERWAGASCVERQLDQVMGSEDFSTMLKLRPGAFMYIGNGASAPLHTPEYDFDDAATPIGAGVLSALVEAKLSQV
jgi:hippurate hydrolase